MRDQQRGETQHPKLALCTTQTCTSDRSWDVPRHDRVHRQVSRSYWTPPLLSAFSWPRSCPPLHRICGTICCRHACKGNRGSDWLASWLHAAAAAASQPFAILVSISDRAVCNTHTPAKGSCCMHLVYAWCLPHKTRQEDYICPSQQG